MGYVGTQIFQGQFISIQLDSDPVFRTRRKLLPTLKLDNGEVA